MNIKTLRFLGILIPVELCRTLTPIFKRAADRLALRQIEVIADALGRHVMYYRPDNVFLFFGNNCSDNGSPVPEFHLASHDVQV